MGCMFKYTLAFPFVYGLYKLIAFIVEFMGFRNWFQDQMCPSNDRLDGKVVLITGGNGGIGAETAKELFKRGAIVYIACRNMEAGESVRQSILGDKVEENGNEDLVRVLHLDLASLSSVRQCVADFRTLCGRLDILINNAGVMMCPHQRSKEGFEMQMATNHIGHFLLTTSLLDMLERTRGRIIIVSSVAHWWLIGDPNFEDVKRSGNKYNATWSYSQSKLANMLFARGLSKRLAESGVTVNCLHPGVVDTPLFRHTAFVKYPLLEWLSRPLRLLFEKSPLLGAQTSIYLAVSKELEGVTGQYFSNCRPGYVSPKAKNDSLADRLWDLSEKWTTEFS